MPQYIKVTFQNNYGEGTKQWQIVDQVCSGNAIWSGYLTYGDSTPELDICSDDGIYGKVIYQREDGAPTVVDNIQEGSIVRMS